MAITPRRRSSARQRGKLHAGAAFLERVGDLQILVLHEHVGAGQRRERRRRQFRRAQHMTGDRAPRGLDIGERHHAPAFFPISAGVTMSESVGIGQVKSFMADPSTKSGIRFWTRRHRHLRRPAAARLRSASNPELFDGVLTRRFVAFVIDLIIIALPLVRGVDVHLRVRLITFGFGWMLFWLLSPASVIWALFYYGTTLGSPASATLGMRAMEIEMRTWYGAPAYFVLGAVHAIVYWVSVSVLTPFILVVGFFNARKRLCTTCWSAPSSSTTRGGASLRGAAAELYANLAFDAPAFSGNLPAQPGGSRLPEAQWAAKGDAPRDPALTRYAAILPDRPLSLSVPRRQGRAEGFHPSRRRARGRTQ